MKKRILLPLLTLLLMLPATASVAGKLDVVAKFGVTGNELAVATYTDATVSPDGPQKVALLAIWKDKRVSFAFDAKDWDLFIALYRKAAQTESASWQFVGTMKESETKDPTLLLITAGPGVRFTEETAEGSFSVVLSPSDFERFEASLRQVKSYLAS
jgi:hypothetical protein